MYVLFSCTLSSTQISGKRREGRRLIISISSIGSICIENWSRLKPSTGVPEIWIGEIIVSSLILRSFIKIPSSIITGKVYLILLYERLWSRSMSVSQHLCLLSQLCCSLSVPSVFIFSKILTIGRENIYERE